MNHSDILNKLSSLSKPALSLIKRMTGKAGRIVKRIGKVIVTFAKLPGQHKIMLFEAAIYSAYYRYLITHKPFSSLSPKIGEFQYETPKEKINDPAISYCQSAIYAACRRVTWDSKCLDQALAAKKILNKRGLPCTLYMGVIMDKDNKMTAHAWLRCGTCPVTGGRGRGYAVTGIYGDRF